MAQIHETAFPHLTDAEIATLSLWQRSATTPMANPFFELAKPISIYTLLNRAKSRFAIQLTAAT